MTDISGDTPQTIREAVGVFESEENLAAAIYDLQTHGFARHDLSVLADASTVEKKLGNKYKRVEQMEDDPSVPRTVFVSKEATGIAEGALIGTPMYVAATAATGIVVASGGELLAAIVAAAGGGVAGALLGVILAKLLGDYRENYIQKQIERGGLLLWVRIQNKEQEQTALNILRKYSAHDAHIHTLRVPEREAA